MTLPNEQLGPIMRQARRRLGLTQRELAADLSTAQSNISAFESGQDGVLARDKIEMAAERLGIDPDTGKPTRGGGVAAVLRTHKYCPRATCSSNVPMDDHGELVIWPRTREGLAGLEEHCRSCGALLVEKCPGCGAPVLDTAAHCEKCGAAYISPTDPVPEDAAAWADARRRRIKELMELMNWPLQ